MAEAEEWYANRRRTAEIFMEAIVGSEKWGELREQVPVAGDAFDAWKRTLAQPRRRPE